MGGITVGLGWLEGTIWGEEPRRALRRFEEVLDLELRPRERGHAHYPAVWQAGPSVWVGFARGDVGQFHFQLKQEAGEHLDDGRLLRLAAWADEVEHWKISRLDVAANDAARRITPAAVAAALEAGHGVTRVRPGHISLTTNQAGGETLYVGSPRSQHRLRVYDKDREVALRTGEDVPLGTYGIRWENQLRDEVATDAARRYFGLGPWAGTTPAPQEVQWSVTRRLVDFRDKRSSSHVERRELLPWWAELVEGAGKADLPRDRAGDDLERVEAWARLQWPKAAAQLQERYGWQFFLDLVDEGMRQLGRQDARTDELLRRRLQGR